MAWFYLVLAGILEIIWAVGLKASDGFSKPLITTVTVLAMIASVALLGLAMRQLPVGTAYAIWTGIGALGTAVVGMLWFKDPATAGRLVCLGLILAGLIGLKLSTP